MISRKDDPEKLGLAILKLSPVYGGACGAADAIAAERGDAWSTIISRLPSDFAAHPPELEEARQNGAQRPAAPPDDPSFLSR